ncbi:hypothetical protein ACO1PK_06520 [Alishewanella sp. d11]|uniref:hypothetical protein n=1 Tax=Alishewanella sp. d11 TaxID=3414030 RepID=UPI003BF8E849
MKQTMIAATLMLIIGLALGYFLAPKVSEPLEPLAASMPATISAAVLPTMPVVAKSPAQLATTPTAPVVETSSAADEKALPAFFAPGEPFAPANSYSELLQQLSYDGQQQLQQLNSSLLGMFEFDHPRKYKYLLEQGMPTPEELALLYNTPMDQQLEQLVSIYQAQSQREAWQPEVQQAYERHAALLANLAIDELIKQYRFDNPDYQQGDSMPDFGAEDWPPNLSTLHRMAMDLYIINSNSRLATNRLAMFKLEQLFTRGDKVDYEVLKIKELAALAQISNLLYSDSVYDTYAAQRNWSDVERSKFVVIGNAILR